MNKIKLKWLLLFVIALQSKVVVARTATPLMIGVENIEYLPYYDGSDQQGSNYYGFSEQLLKLFANSYGYKFDFYSLPINRLYKDFIVQDYIDFKYPDNPQWHQDYKKKYAEIKPVTYSNKILTTVTGIASLKKSIVLSECLSFAKVRGFTSQSYKTYFDKKEIEVTETADTSELISLLILKRVDCIYISHDVLQYQLSKEFADAAIYFQNHLRVDEQNFYLSSIKHPEIILQFNQFLSRSSHEIAILKKRFKIKGMKE